MGDVIDFVHQTVLVAETVAMLEPKEGRMIVDGTLGGGGHAEALLERGAVVVGLERDPSALAAAKQRLARFGSRFTAIEGQFADAQALVGRPVDGLLLDLGVSSPQLDSAERGFSFRYEGPLDMRMSRSGETAAELIDRLGEAQLADVIFELGEERFSRPIAKALKARSPKTTQHAVQIIQAAVPKKAWPKQIHVATRTFQALRMAVNDELGQLNRALEALPKLLNPLGRAAIITFHSLEDRRVKQAFRRLSGEAPQAIPRGLPVTVRPACATFRDLSKKPICASADEVAHNPRARSAKLRGVEKLQ